jgi:hypothetical protein
VADSGAASSISTSSETGVGSSAVGVSSPPQAASKALTSTKDIIKKIGLNFMFLSFENLFIILHANLAGL